MVDGITVRLNRQLAHRDVSIRIHEQQWNPGTMIETTLGVLFDGSEAGVDEEISGFTGKERCTGCRVFQFVHGLGEAIEIVDGVVGGVDDIDFRGARVPVSGDDKDGLRTDTGHDLGTPGFQKGTRWDGVVDGKRGRAVGEVVSVHGDWRGCDLRFAICDCLERR